MKRDEYIKGVGSAEFSKSNLVQAGVIRELEVIGEAAKRLSREVREKYPDIPWKKMVGMRDKLIHNYLGVDLDSVWDTVKKDIPALKIEIKRLIKKKESRTPKKR